MYRWRSYTRRCVSSKRRHLDCGERARSPNPAGDRARRTGTADHTRTENQTARHADRGGTQKDTQAQSVTNSEPRPTAPRRKRNLGDEVDHRSTTRAAKREEKGHRPLSSFFAGLPGWGGGTKKTAVPTKRYLSWACALGWRISFEDLRAGSINKIAPCKMNYSGLCDRKGHCGRVVTQNSLISKKIMLFVLVVIVFRKKTLAQSKSHYYILRNCDVSSFCLAIEMR